MLKNKLFNEWRVRMVKKQLVIGVDFDGTLVEESFPTIGKIKQEVVEFIDKAKSLGHLVIIWTARSGEPLKEATEFLNKNNINYDYINDNPECEWARRGEQGRKIFCDIYLDDRALHVDDVFKAFDYLNGEKSSSKLNKVYAFCNKVIYEDGYALDNDIPYKETPIEFDKGEIVEVVKQIDEELFIIYSKDTNNSGTIHKDLITLI